MGNLTLQLSRCCLQTRLNAILIIPLLFSVTNTARAQSGLLEEITVTAQKRSQSIQDVGISITAFSGEQMKELGFENDPVASAELSRDFGNYAPLPPHIALGEVTVFDDMEAVLTRGESLLQSGTP